MSKSQDDFRSIFKRKREDDAAKPAIPAAAAGAAGDGGEAPAPEKAAPVAFFANLPTQTQESYSIENAPVDRSFKLAQALMGKSKASLPPGWIVKTSRKQKKGAQYYVNKYTGEARREMPTLPAEPRKKKPGSGAKAAAGGAAQAAKPKKEATVTDALKTLAGSLRREDKFKKAAKMLVTLMNTYLSEGNSPDFFAALQNAFINRAWVNKDTMRKEYQALLSAVAKKQEMFSAEQQAAIEVWHFRAVTHNELFTDDTFAFARAVSAVESIIKTRQEATGAEAAAPEAAVAVAPSAEATDCSSPWEEAFIDCMKTVYSYYKYPWATSIVERTFTTFYSLKDTFSEYPRLTLEKMTVNIRATQRRRK